MNNKGQLTIEYIILCSILLITLVLTINTITNEVEKNTILSAAQIGAQNGINKNGYATYYNDTFNNYNQHHPQLLTPTTIKIINRTLDEKNKTIFIQTTVTTKTTLDTQEKNIMGSRINYYIRKSITDTFGKNPTNIYYDPAKSENYIIKTQPVIWK